MNKLPLSDLQKLHEMCKDNLGIIIDMNGALKLPISPIQMEQAREIRRKAIDLYTKNQNILSDQLIEYAFTYWEEPNSSESVDKPKWNKRLDPQGY